MIIPPGIDSKQMGLGIYLTLGRYLLKTEYLHFGYWIDDLKVELSNLPQAQENHSNFIIHHIPPGVKTILDVGCGTGKLAHKLIDLGYQVDCVSPDLLLSQHARELLGNKSHIYECTYEDLQLERRYDLILFSESFQYVDLEQALQDTVKNLNEGGYLLICDYFQTEATGKSPLSGGHKLKKFYDQLLLHPLEIIKDRDITRETAPNLDIVDDILSNVGLPVWNLIFSYLNGSYSLLSKLLQWKYRKKIKKINRKYFSGTRNAANFKVFKSYRFFLCQKTNSDGSV